MNTNISLVVVWDGRAFVDLSLGLQYEGSTCGLCGNFNNNTEDDFGDVSGSVLEIYQCEETFWIGGKGDLLFPQSSLEIIWST